MRKISIIHPTRQRHLEAAKTCNVWLRNADHPKDIEYIFSVDSDDGSKMYIRPERRVNFIEHPNKSAIEAINNAAKIATGDIFIVVSDDFSAPNHWDTLLLAALEGKEDFCVKTQDGIQPVLMTLPIMDRKYYERFGYIYHPDYLHMYSDQEMTAVAIMTGKAIFLDLIFEHKHYSTGKFAKDDINIKNDKTYPQGKQVFERRLRNNFGIANPVCSYRSIKWH